MSEYRKKIQAIRDEVEAEVRKLLGEGITPEKIVVLSAGILKDVHSDGYLSWYGDGLGIHEDCDFNQRPESITWLNVFDLIELYDKLIESKFSSTKYRDLPEA